MIILKSRHKELVSTILESHKAEVYQLKARINDLKEQIKDLNKLVFPAPTSQTIPKEAREFDAVISASEKSPEMSEEERNRILDGIREMDLIVSGNYDEGLLQ